MLTRQDARHNSIKAGPFDSHCGFRVTIFGPCHPAAKTGVGVMVSAAITVWIILLVIFLFLTWRSNVRKGD